MGVVAEHEAEKIEAQGPHLATMADLTGGPVREPGKKPATKPGKMKTV